MMWIELTPNEVYGIIYGLNCYKDDFLPEINEIKAKLQSALDKAASEGQYISLT
jgi:hypothetical protein